MAGAQFAPHAAFTDPTTPPNASNRIFQMPKRRDELLPAARSTG